MKRPLIVVRPEPGNAATAARARALGLDARAAPIFAIASVAWSADPPDAYVGVLLTSANAVRHAGPGLAEYAALPACAVGEASAAAARAAGFVSVVTGDGDVARLMAKIATLGLHKLLHLSGEEVTPFDSIGIKIDRHVVYHTVGIAPPADFPWKMPVILVHSRRAGARLAALVDADSRRTASLICISEAAAADVGTGWQQLAVAPEPRDEAMLRIAADWCRG